jgi:hypothetical protein
MSVIHIKATSDVKDNILSELMNILIKYGYSTEKYLGIASKIIMAKQEKKTEGGKDEE